MEKKTVSPSVGLREDEVLQSRRAHGENILSRQKRKSFLRQFLGNFNDPVIRILLAALGVHLLLLFGNGDLAETVGIGIAVFLATFISTLSEYGSARAFERLEEDAGGILCRVRRGGKVKEIPIREVVVGDVVLLSAGDAIPADGRMLLGALRADQAAATLRQKWYTFYQIPLSVRQGRTAWRSSADPQSDQTESIFLKFQNIFSKFSPFVENSTDFTP
ncbi:MAG: cation-transporting P-type ATPase [Clostridia bacterium]|nr:cation-transporting P-type ATPase [Clostridia bacterium]